MKGEIAEARLAQESRNSTKGAGFEMFVARSIFSLIVMVFSLKAPAGIAKLFRWYGHAQVDVLEPPHLLERHRPKV